MASAPLLILEAANIFVNNRDKSLIIRNVALPKLEEIKVPHMPGGAIGEIEISLGVKHFEVPFYLAGRDPDTLKYFGAALVNTGFGNTFTIYEALRDENTKIISNTIAVITGRLSSATFDPFQRGIISGVYYTITEITAYTLTIAGVQIYAYNWLSGSFKVNQVEQNVNVLQVQS